ncbi:hypothetical protein HC766_02285 [Candidatus Gracilibacteria bacterium]|nr:hypothetical protein [Candidatus Gracilibacteria bacterium]
MFLIFSVFVGSSISTFAQDKTIATDTFTKEPANNSTFTGLKTSKTFPLDATVYSISLLHGSGFQYKPSESSFGSDLANKPNGTRAFDITECTVDGYCLAIDNTDSSGNSQNQKSLVFSGCSGSYYYKSVSPDDGGNRFYVTCTKQEDILYESGAKRPDTVVELQQDINDVKAAKGGDEAKKQAVLAKNLNSTDTDLKTGNKVDQSGTSGAAQQATNPDANDGGADLWTILFNLVASILLIFVWLLAWLIFWIFWIVAYIFLILIQINPAGTDFINVAIAPWQIVVSIANIVVLGSFIFIGFGYLLNIGFIKNNKPLGICHQHYYRSCDHQLYYLWCSYICKYHSRSR